ncbi:MAG: hypothetical protein IPO81_18465 [Kouleothrix sp.]|nr:hypothetical protein [Kouleothrix sp.]
MRTPPPSVLLRPVLLLVLLLGILALGAQPSAWATPSQSPPAGTVPTRTPNPGPRLNLSEVKCSNQSISIEFVAVQLPDSVTDYGTVTYVVNGQSGTAAFSKRTGGVAHYLGTIATPAPDDRYSVTSASVTLATSGGPITLSLSNPGTFTVKNCKKTATVVGRCDEPLRHTLTPGSAVQLIACQWSVALGPGGLKAAGMLEIKLISPAVSRPPNAGDSFFGQHVEVTLFDSQGNAVPHPTLDTPIVLCALYTADDLARVKSAASFAIQTFDVATATWVALPTTLDAASNQACTTLPHLSLFALSAPRSALVGAAPSAGVVPASLPHTGGQVEWAIPAWMWLAIGLLLGAGAALAARRQLSA